MAAPLLPIQRHEVGPRFSEAAVHNGVAYLAGQVPTPSASGGDIAVQAASALAEVDRVLALCGTDRSRLLMVTIVLRDVAGDAAGMNAIYEGWIAGSPAPPRATIQAALVKPEWRIEVIATAAVA